MSIHPNAMLLAHLHPNDLARKTWRAILDHTWNHDRNHAGTSSDDPYLTIGSLGYHLQIMEGDYLDGMQVSGQEGDIVLIGYATYGYGERIAWEKLVEERNALDEWATDICERFNCTHAISVSANYW